MLDSIKPPRQVNVLRLLFIALTVMSAGISGVAFALVGRTGRLVYLIPAVFTFGLMLVSIFAASIS
jgi:hypothetical protein